MKLRYYIGSIAFIAVVNLALGAALRGTAFTCSYKFGLSFVVSCALMLLAYALLGDKREDV